jgi:hypothetical protein
MMQYVAVVERETRCEAAGMTRELSEELCREKWLSEATAVIDNKLTV